MAVSWAESVRMSTNLQSNKTSIDHAFSGYVSDYFDSIYKRSSDHPAFRWIFILIYTVIIILGVFGNIMVCIAVKRNRSLHTPTYVFICNLSVSDVAVCLLCLPLTLVYTLTDTWLFGKFLCYTVTPLQAISVLVSTLTMTAIAVDRYNLVMYPLKKRITLLQSGAVIVLIWMFSLGLSVPLIFYRLYEELSYPDLNLHSILCTESWPSAKSKQSYTLTIFSFQYALPIFFIATSYARVWVKLRNRVMPGVLTSEQIQSDTVRRQKTNKMLMAVVAVFGVCWLPLNVWIVISEFNFKLLNDRWIDLSYHICHSLAMVTTCINPFLYGRLSDAFRKEFITMFPWRSRRPSSRNALCQDRGLPNDGINLATLRRTESEMNFTHSRQGCPCVENYVGSILTNARRSSSSPSSNPTQISANLI
ncbi:prolactin-releasing peptide receptor-like [Ptychodera flava]|uniref:prolactin-releasing peptide receptor-like n=1 Tax=Ptychodera flava TaxID=63121 RepID=UPI00396A519C